MKKLKVRNVAIAAIAVLLLATMAMSMQSTESAFAGKYSKNKLHLMRMLVEMEQHR